MSCMFIYFMGFLFMCVHIWALKANERSFHFVPLKFLTNNCVTISSTQIRRCQYFHIDCCWSLIVCTALLFYCFWTHIRVYGGILQVLAAETVYSACDFSYEVCYISIIFYWLVGRAVGYVGYVRERSLLCFQSNLSLYFPYIDERA